MGLRCTEHLAGVGPGGQQWVVAQHLGISSRGRGLFEARTSTDGAEWVGSVDAFFVVTALGTAKPGSPGRRRMHHAGRQGATGSPRLNCVCGLRLIGVLACSTMRITDRWSPGAAWAVAVQSILPPAFRIARWRGASWRSARAAGMVGVKPSELVRRRTSSSPTPSTRPATSVTAPRATSACRTASKTHVGAEKHDRR